MGHVEVDRPAQSLTGVHNKGGLRACILSHEAALPPLCVGELGMGSRGPAVGVMRAYQGQLQPRLSARPVPMLVSLILCPSNWS